MRISDWSSDVCSSDLLDVLVVDLHALQAIDLLDLIDEIVGQGLDAHHLQDVVRRRVAIEQMLALAHEVAFLHGDMLALRDQVFDRIDTLFRRLQHQATLGLVVLAELDTTVDLGNDRMVLRTPGLEQFGDTRQTAGDVTRLGAFHRDTRQNVAGMYLCTIFNRENGSEESRVGKEGGSKS